MKKTSFPFFLPAICFLLEKETGILKSTKKEQFLPVTVTKPFVLSEFSSTATDDSQKAGEGRGPSYPSQPHAYKY